MEQNFGNQSAETARLLSESAFMVEQELYDAADPDAKYVVTVHRTETGSVGNIWYSPTEGEPYRLLPERVLPGEPNALVLVGEVNRFATAMQDKLNEDLSLKLGILGLHYAAIHLVETIRESKSETI